MFVAFTPEVVCFKTGRFALSPWYFPDILDSGVNWTHRGHRSPSDHRGVTPRPLPCPCKSYTGEPHAIVAPPLQDSLETAKKGHQKGETQMKKAIRRVSSLKNNRNRFMRNSCLWSSEFNYCATLICFSKLKHDGQVDIEKTLKHPQSMVKDSFSG